MPLSQACIKAAMKGSNVDWRKNISFPNDPQRQSMCARFNIQVSQREGTWKTRCVVQVILVSSRCLSQL